MGKFKNKYKTSSMRLQSWDYGWNAAYFITFCTANRECFFGNIQNGKMNLSEIGKLANQFLLEIPERYDYADLDEFVVMPDHVHVILHIEKIKDDHNYGSGNAINRVPSSKKSVSSSKKSISSSKKSVSNSKKSVSNSKKSVSKSTELEDPTSTKSQQNHKKPGGITGNKNPMLHDNISRILNWYKGRVTFESRKINPDFAWQSLFYDHIIRDDKSYQRIKKYIINNPRNWKGDSLYN